jgi:PAS domain S-box-containing protein
MTGPIHSDALPVAGRFGQNVEASGPPPARGIAARMSDFGQASSVNEDQFRAVVELLPHVVFTHAPDGTCDYVNQRFYELTGLPRGESLGDDWVRAIHPDDLPSIEREWETARTEGRSCEYRFRLRMADGSYRWMLSRNRPMVVDGRPVRWVGSCADIDDLVRSQEELSARTQELTRSNAELEQFASIVSHDLRSPLLSLTGCVELLSEQYTGQLDRDADELIEFTKKSVARMGELIKDLLDYSRVGSRNLEVEPVRLAEVVGHVLDSLGSELEKSDGQVTHDELPEVLADRTRMVQLFQNLLENAIKYRSDKPVRIHIGVEPDARVWRFAVRDNGIGISPEHHEKIFRVFARLHAEDSQYTGTGIGLAVAKKIVERHGGRIWLESAPGEGSTFYFTLPRTV